MVNAQEYINQKYPNKEQRKSITELNISRKKLTGSLDLQDFPNLKILLCSENELIEIKVSKCPKLKSVDCWNNKLKELDFTNNHQLEGLVCSYNQLTSLKLGNNQNLAYLDCSNNQLTNLNSINNSPLLVDLICHNNPLEIIDNYNFPQLAKEKFIWTNQAQQWLDWLCPVEEKNKVKKLSISNKQLGGSLKIERFNNLEEVEFPWNGFFGNGISELIISQCPKLRKVNCWWSGNSLSKLTVDGLESLEDLNCAKNQLTELNINGCPNLKTLDCSSNKLTNLDLINFKQLKQLDIRNNDFSEQEVSTPLKNFNTINENSKMEQQNINSQYEVVIFLCHGLGSSAIWFQSSVEQLRREFPYNFKLILPQAPTIKVDFGAITGAKISPLRPSWYNIVSWEDVWNGNNDHGLLTSVAQINKLIDQEITKGIKPENIIIAGLSQGGSLALAIGLTSERKLGGIIGWASFIPYQKVLQERLTDISREIPFFLMHDCTDRIVEYKVSKEVKNFLQENGYSLQFKNYFGAGHDHKLMMNDTINLLKKQLLANRGLSERDFTKQINIEIVEIKERELTQTNIEIPPKVNN